MPGTPPKPPDRRQRKRRPGQKDARAVNLSVLPPARAKVPDPPPGLLRENQQAWRDYWRSDLARLCDTDTALVSLRRLFSMRDRQARALRVAEDSPLVEGSQGQPRPNPMWKVALELEGHIRALEDRFGLSPRGLIQLGAQFGNAARSLQDLNRGYVDRPEEGPDPRVSMIEDEDGK